MFFCSIKEISTLMSKGMSNTHLKVAIEKDWHSQTLVNLVPQHRGYKNREIKVMLWWAVDPERKKSAFFVKFIFYEGICF